MSFPYCRFFVGVFCLVAIAGCGKPLVMLHGRVAVKGQPFKWDDDTQLEVKFLSDQSPDLKQAPMSYSAQVDRDCNFTITGAEGRGIPPGTYKVAVRNSSARPSANKPLAVLKGIDDPAKSTMKYEVTANPNQRIVIDLESKTVELQP